MTPQEFIRSISAAAQVSASISKIPASFVIAQAALESAWGSSGLSRNSKNLFGIKADTAWRGEFSEAPTREYLKGQWVTVLAKWRKYPDFLACIDDHALFFRNNKRYAACFIETAGEGWAKAVERAGYATDPYYSKKICAIIHQYNLQQYDM
jgi:flagellum-specific peptidoglycan hydrolase FlgJ